MAEKSASTAQVFRWALKNIGTILAILGLVSTVTLAWYHWQSQWHDHVDPDCKDKPSASVCQIVEMRRDIKELRGDVTKVLFLLQQRRPRG